ncbi:MAG: hypothetical protein ISR90_04505 [Candidatus Marinimicrobia bacterium]|nr:hypothetical protein [Candidatus Neomarinimicrobiota bacterium]MBL7023299.1 hypothetical protein [Candidatus Neomarinimicrobiota bacterium]
MKQYPNEKFVSFISGEYRGILLYPRVQVKILRNQLCIFAVNEGVEPTKSFLQKMKSLEIDGTTYVFAEQNISENFNLFEIIPNQYKKYKFITPWVALNERQSKQYDRLFFDEKRVYLNEMLVKNLSFICTDLGRSSKEELQVRFRASSLTPKIVDYSKNGSFKGFFTTNVILPNFIGIGNGIAKGLGTIIKLQRTTTH